ncbi:MAG: type II/IV secretion system protein, partial [Candidatus Kerfeldbacteria bacterium]|nr:type II/IV secretion system protein [Candidatus Kerfeldbacteria bacterium]
MPSILRPSAKHRPSAVDLHGGLHVASGDIEEKLSEKMSQIGLREKERAAEGEAAARGIPYIDLSSFPIAPEVLSLVPEGRAARLHAVPFFKNDAEIRLATTSPDSPEVLTLLAELTERHRANGLLYLITDHSLERALELYKHIPHPKKYLTGVAIAEDELERLRASITSFRDIQAQLEHVSMTEMLTLVLAGAIDSRSTDVHIEAEEEHVKIRYRIDGVLQDIAELPKETWPKLISRVKLLAQLKLNISDVPQDGRFTIYLTKERIEVRVSTLPTAFGESVVLRLLLSSAASLTLEDLGLRTAAHELLKHEFTRPNGMIITTGPTGSGKTTTLYAILKTLNSPDRKIITLEDPIEYKLPGISQSQVHESAGQVGGGEAQGLAKLFKTTGAREYSFARGLRSILRQDPDIIMVGEIRDQETAEIAIQAALTGHLVLSTIHTNSAAGAVPRFIAMNVKPFLLAPALNAIVAQRLVRRICPDCKEAYTPTPEELAWAKAELERLPQASGEHPDLANLTFSKGRGCTKCYDLGYRGRVG